MPIVTRLTEQLGIDHPVLSAPMAFAAGGKLAAAVSRAGGLGMIGGGYGDADWLEAQFREAGNAEVGCGFITWSLRQQPDLLDAALAHRPSAVFLSFGDAAPFAARIKDAGAQLIMQVQRRRDAEDALALEPDILVAQGAEAGGHGETRATMTLVPELADLIAERAPATLLCAAGGIADGRGLAAALMLGADGVVVGSRFWAADEALVHDNHQAAATEASGDDTIRQSVSDIARGLDWPERFNIRVVRNRFIDQWLGREDEMRAAGERLRADYARAVVRGDADTAPAIAGEAVALIDEVRSAEVILTDIIDGAKAQLAKGGNLVRPGAQA